MKKRIGDKAERPHFPDIFIILSELKVKMHFPTCTRSLEIGQDASVLGLFKSIFNYCDYFDICGFTIVWNFGQTHYLPPSSGAWQIAPRCLQEVKRPSGRRTVSKQLHSFLISASFCGDRMFKAGMSSRIVNSLTT